MNVAPGISSSDIENLISRIKNREGSHYFPPDEKDEWLDEAAHFLTIMLIRIKEECDDGIEIYNSGDDFRSYYGDRSRDDVISSRTEHPRNN